MTWANWRTRDYRRLEDAGPKVRESVIDTILFICRLAKERGQSAQLLVELVSDTFAIRGDDISREIRILTQHGDLGFGWRFRLTTPEFLAENK